MSRLRYMVSDNQKHLRPISDVDRAAWEHFVERPQLGAGRDALDTKVVAVGAGPAGWPAAAIFAFFWRLGTLAGPLIV